MLETVHGSVIKTTGRCAAVRHRPQFTGFEHLPKEMNEGKKIVGKGCLVISNFENEHM